MLVLLPDVSAVVGLAHPSSFILSMPWRVRQRVSGDLILSSLLLLCTYKYVKFSVNSLCWGMKANELSMQIILMCVCCQNRTQWKPKHEGHSYLSC